MTRRRGPFRICRRNPLLRLVIAFILGGGAYWGKSSWQGTSSPNVDSPATQTSSNQTGGELTLVERVVDGDTLVISGGDRIRLIGVDTPETHHPTKSVQPFGPEAYEFTRGMIEGKQVQLRFDPGETKDRYGRTLAYVYIDGQFLNELLIRKGLARSLTTYHFSREMKAIFISAEAAARAERKGIWSLPQQKTEVGHAPSQRKAG